jgi:two-component system LytT family response regulator
MESKAALMKTYRMKCTNANTVRFVNQAEILYIKAEENYSIVFLRDETSFVLSKTLKTLEHSLNVNSFFRCHRSFLVNIYFVRNMYQTNKGNFIQMMNSEKIPVARRRKGVLRTII